MESDHYPKHNYESDGNEMEGGRESITSIWEELVMIPTPRFEWFHLFCQLSILVKALQQFLIRLQPFHATPNQSNHLKWCIQSDDSCTPFYQYEWSSCFLWCNHCTWREGCSENPLDSPIASDHTHSERPSHRIREGRCCRGGKLHTIQKYAISPTDILAVVQNKSTPRFFSIYLKT